jgi:hypothetical protein
MSSPPPNDLPPGLRPASQLAERTLEWLWPLRLALGKLAILDGDPGMGKSLLALDLCARLSQGLPWPDGSPGPGPAAALVLNAEDHPDEVIRPRLRALGANMDQVYVWDRFTEDGEPLHFPTHTALLDQAVAATGARLVVIDPITAFLDAGVNINSDPSVRRALRPLDRLATERRCVMLFHRHLNKYGGHHALYRGGGSIGIVGVCRTAWLVAPDPHGPEQSVLAEGKNNLAGKQPSLAYAVRRGDGVAPTLSWLGTSPLTGDQLLAAAAAAPARLPERERARAFLTAALEQGPRTSRELWPLAQRARLSQRTVKRAKADLGVRSARVCVDAKRLDYWLLRHQQLPDGVSAETATPELDEYLARLNEQFPPSTPLDDL